MKRAILIVGIAVVVLAILAAFGAFYTVREFDQVVITQFERPIGEPITKPGLKFKTPFIQKVHRYEKRILRWDGQPKEVPTRDKRFIWVDTMARWRIVDALKFRRVLGDYGQAYAKLDDVIDGVVRDYVSANSLVELVRSTDWIEKATREGTGGVALPEEAARESIKLGREKIEQAIQAEASKVMPAFGIELVDLRIKRLNYVPRVRRKVYERMISERNRKAAQYRSEGEGRAAEIIGEMEKDLKRIESGAYRKAREIRGRADAEATRIYGDAYGQDPDFYAFLKTLEAYKETPFKNAVIILGTDSDYYRFLKEIPE